MADEVKVPKTGKITVAQITEAPGYVGFETAPLTIRDGSGNLHQVYRFAFEQDADGKKVVVLGAKIITVRHDDL